MLIGILILAGIGLIYAILMSARYQNDQTRLRHQERAAWGSAKGLEPVDRIRENPGIMSGPLTSIPSSRMEHLRPHLVPHGTVQNLLEGFRGGRKVDIFDLIVQGTEESASQDYGVVAITLNRMVPQFEIIPRTGWHRFIGSLGFHGLKTSDFEFDEKLQIPNWSDGNLLKYLDGELRSRLLENPVYTCRSNGRFLVVRKLAKCTNSDFEEMLSLVLLFADKLEEA